MEITTTTTTYKLNPEESAVLLCELAHENCTANIPSVTKIDVDRILQESEFYRNQKKWGGNI